MFKDKFSTQDDILTGITYDDIITAVQSNEKEINKNTIKKVFKEILETNMKDAQYLLEKNMDQIIELSK